jgi:hypothetical protein
MLEYKTMDFCQLKLPLVLQIDTKEKGNSLMTAMYECDRHIRYGETMYSVGVKQLCV